MFAIWLTTRRSTWGGAGQLLCPHVVQVATKQFHIIVNMLFSNWNVSNYKINSLFALFLHSSNITTKINKRVSSIFAEAMTIAHNIGRQRVARE